MNDDQKRRYIAAAHRMQSGVAGWENVDPKETSPKHLRVGVNCSMSDIGALAKLLIAKGVITEDEYMEAVIAGLVAEGDSYEKMLSEHYKTKVTLA